MTLKVVITYYAHQEDWDIEETLDGRRPSNPSAQEDLKEMFAEDVHFMWEKGDIEITEAKDSSI
jgi:hypothetical protein